MKAILFTATFIYFAANEVFSSIDRKIIHDDNSVPPEEICLGRDEKDNSFYIQSKNCILHKVASNNQDMICHGLHDKIISKSLEGNNSDVKIELKECMALGNEYCRHVIRSNNLGMLA